MTHLIEPPTEGMNKISAILRGRREALPHSGVGRAAAILTGHLVAGVLVVVIFYLSLIATSVPVTPENNAVIGRAVELLGEKGFTREAFLLRHAVSYRASDNWLNTFVADENAYAATNFPFEIITVYPDFYSKTKDDNERAMILLHEAQHLQMSNDNEAYAYVWRNRERLGWTQLTYGATPTFVSVALQTRENSPELFTCTSRVWNDCTETLPSKENHTIQTASVQ